MSWSAPLYVRWFLYRKQGLIWVGSMVNWNCVYLKNRKWRFSFRFLISRVTILNWNRWGRTSETRPTWMTPHNFGCPIKSHIYVCSPHIFPPTLFHISHPSLSERLTISDFKSIPVLQISDPSLSERHVSNFAYLNFHLIFSFKLRISKLRIYRFNFMFSHLLYFYPNLSFHDYRIPICFKSIEKNVNLIKEGIIFCGKKIEIQLIISMIMLTRSSNKV